VDALAYPPEELLELRDSVGRLLEALREGGEDASAEGEYESEGARETGAAG